MKKVIDILTKEKKKRSKKRKEKYYLYGYLLL
jgi:hypothetical protein